MTSRVNPLVQKNNLEAGKSPEIHVLEVRGQRVVLDEAVAMLFGSETKKLNQQVTRNQDKFGDDFSFVMTKEEFETLRSQNVTSSLGWGGRRYPPRVFTEHGVVMAATIIKSPEAIRATRHIVKVFVDANLEAWERQKLGKSATQLPLALDKPLQQGLTTKLNMALGHVLDAIVDPSRNKTVRDEAREIAAEGMNSIKEYLKRAGIGNEKSLSEVHRIMAEAENIRAETARKRTENEHRQLALLAKQIRLIIQAQQYAETGSVDGLLAVLADLERN